MPPHPFLLLCHASCLTACHLPPPYNGVSEPTEGKIREVKVGTYVNSMLLILCYPNKKYYYYLPLEAFPELLKKRPLGFQVHNVLKCLEGSGPFRSPCWVSLSAGLKPFFWVYLSESLKRPYCRVRLKGRNGNRPDPFDLCCSLNTLISVCILGVGGCTRMTITSRDKVEAWGRFQQKGGWVARCPELLLMRLSAVAFVFNECNQSLNEAGLWARSRYKPQNLGWPSCVAGVLWAKKRILFSNLGCLYQLECQPTMN